MPTTPLNRNLSGRDQHPTGLSHPLLQNALAPLGLASLLGLMLPLLPAAAEDAASQPPPDPLTLPAEPTTSRSGYFGSDAAVSALEPPPRMQVGDFVLRSRATLAAVYDDNIEADDEERDEDIFFAFSPSLRAQSLYARHSLGLEAGGRAATAVKNGAEDYVDWRVGADGRIDLSRQRKINAAIGYSRDTEDDEAVDAEDNRDDLPINLFDAGLSYDVAGDTVGYSIGASVARLNAEGSDFDDRDRTTVGADAQASYAASDRLSFFAGPSYRYATFDEDVADDGDGRDSEVISARLGASYKASRTINTSASLGYSFIEFEDPDRADDDSLIGNLGLTWDAGAGTSLQLRAGRSLGTTIVDDADSRTATTGSATLNHLLRLGSRSVMSSSLSYAIAEFSDLDRTDHDLGARLGYAYRLSEHVFFNAGYRFSRRDSDDDDADFYRHLVSLGVSVAY